MSWHYLELSSSSFICRYRDSEISRRMERAFVFLPESYILNSKYHSAITLSNKHEPGGKIREAMPKCRTVSLISCIACIESWGRSDAYM